MRLDEVSTQTLTRVFWLAAAAAVFFSFLRPVDYVDVWYHLCAGQRMAQTRSILNVDAFSLDFRGQPWFNHEWLYEVALYGLYAALGLAGVSLLKAILATGCLLFFVLRLRKMSVPWPYAAAAALALRTLPLGAFSIWRDKADLVTLFFLSVLFWAQEGPDGELPAGWWRWLPAIFWLWANAHGLAPLGLALLAALGAGQLCSGRPGWRRTAAAVAACFAATLLTPQGFSLYSKLLGVRAVLSDPLIYEFLPPSFGEAPWFWLSAAGVWLALILAGRRDRRFPFAVAACALLTWEAGRHQRFIADFAVCAWPYGAACLASTAWARKAADAILRRERALAAAAVLAATAGAAVCARGVGSGVFAQEAAYFPQAADFIERNRIAGPFYNDYEFGSYWIWRFRGHPPVFLDGRCGAIEGCWRTFAQASRAKRSPALWSSFLDEHGFQAALVDYPPSNPDAPPLLFNFFPRDRWALVYWDDMALILLRRSAPNQDAIARNEFKWIAPEAGERWMRGALAAAPQELRAGAASDLIRNLTLHPDSLRARRWREVLGF